MLPPYSILSTSPVTITLVETMKVYGEDFLVFLIQRKVRYNNKTVQASVHSQCHQALLITDFSWCHFLPPWSVLVSTASKIFLKNHFDWSFLWPGTYDRCLSPIRSSPAPFHGFYQNISGERTMFQVPCRGICETEVLVLGLQEF